MLFAIIPLTTTVEVSWFYFVMHCVMIIFVNNSVISSHFSLVVILGCSFAVSRILNVINMSVKIILKRHES